MRGDAPRLITVSQGFLGHLYQGRQGKDQTRALRMAFRITEQIPCCHVSMNGAAEHPYCAGPCRDLALMS